MFSHAEFFLEKIPYDADDWAVYGKIFAMTSYIERRLREVAGYFSDGYYGPNYWPSKSNRPRWEHLVKDLQTAARNADLGALSNEAIQAAGEAKKLFKKRGALAHSILIAGERAQQAVHVKFNSEGAWETHVTDCGTKEINGLLQELIDCYDWLEACFGALSYARGKRGRPPAHPRLEKIAEALRRDLTEKGG